MRAALHHFVSGNRRIKPPLSRHVSRPAVFVGNPPGPAMRRA